MRLIILLAILGAALAVPKRQQQRIVGGEPTTVEEYPYMSNMEWALMGYYWYQYCGGALITSTTVLSAAHCYYGDSPSVWRVRLGSSMRSSGGSLHYATRLLIHSEYNSVSIENDIAIVSLATPAVYSASVGVARIGGTNYNLPSGTLVRSIGWGALELEGSSSEQLQQVETQLIDQEICAERYAYLKAQTGNVNYPEVTNGMICSGILDVGGKDACQGDSGGPLAHAGDVIVGITSWGYGCADEYYPGVNTRVSYYSSWIVANGST